MKRLYVIMTLLITMLFGCASSSLKVDLTYEKYTPRFQLDKYSAFKDKRIFMSPFINYSSNASRYYYYSSDFKIQYGRDVVIEDYYWYCFRKAFNNIGMITYHDVADASYPVFIFEIDYLTDQKIIYEVIVSKRSKIFYQKQFAITMPVPEQKEKQYLEDRAYLMVDNIITNVLNDQNFYLALTADELRVDKIISMIFDGAWQFSEGRAVVMVNGNYGVIDIEGKYIAEPKYDIIGDFHGGFANVKLNGKWGYIDRTGKVVIPIKYEYVSVFSEGLAAIEINGKYGFIDSTGKVVIEPKYEYCYFFSEGLAGVVIKDRLGFINRNGELVIPAIYNRPKWTYGIESRAPQSGAREYLDFPQGVQALSLGGKWGYINNKGKIIYPSGFRSYNNLPSVFNSGMASVKLENHAGFIDKTGKEIIPFKFIDCSNFNEGYAVVRESDKYGLIDRIGKKVISVKYDLLFVPTEGLPAYALDYSAGYGGSVIYKYGFLNIQGEKTISHDYDYAMPFNEGLSAVIKGKRLGFIDKSGNLIFPFKYDGYEKGDILITSFVDGFAPVRENDKYRYIKHPFAVEKTKK